MNCGTGPDILHKQGKQPENMIPHNRDWHHPRMKRSAKAVTHEIYPLELAGKNRKWAQ
jgi:hypothetical protein